jgi:hypothetical protein
VDIKLKKYQDNFLFSEARFCALIAGVGTGKTLALLFKAWMHCERCPNSLALIIRKEFTDLRDSTIQDFNRYFGVHVTSGTKEYTFPNGSKILFRHGNENDLSVLKNMNLSFIGIEQAEEYESDEIFNFLRDRLRRQEAKLRQFAIIANARGQNWVWKLWIYMAEEMNVIDESVGFNEYKRDEYYCCTANSFANEDNLPPDFIADLKRMAVEAPKHYAQYIMNDFTVLEEDDLLLTTEEMQATIHQQFPYRASYNDNILAIDVSRYGDDKCVAVQLQQKGPTHFEEVDFWEWGKKDTMHTTGRIMALISELRPLITVVDGDGLGAGVVDRLLELKRNIVEYRGGKLPPKGEIKNYINNIAYHSFLIKDMIANGRLKLLPDVQAQAQTIRFYYDSKGRQGIVSKEKMRAKGIKSPDHWDAVRMAVSETINVGALQKMEMQKKYADGGGMLQSRQQDPFYGIM